MINLKQAYFLFIVVLVPSNQTANNKLFLISMFKRMRISDWLFLLHPNFPIG